VPPPARLDVGQVHRRAQRCAGVLEPLARAHNPQRREAGQEERYVRLPNVVGAAERREEVLAVLDKEHEGAADRQFVTMRPSIVVDRR
jgi:hypothetical protein